MEAATRWRPVAALRRGDHSDAGRRGGSGKLVLVVTISSAPILNAVARCIASCERSEA